jgi:hypothetical protein
MHVFDFQVCNKTQNHDAPQQLAGCLALGAAQNYEFIFKTLTVSISLYQCRSITHRISKTGAMVLLIESPKGLKLGMFSDQVLRKRILPSRYSKVAGLLRWIRIRTLLTS